MCTKRGECLEARLEIGRAGWREAGAVPPPPPPRAFRWPFSCAVIRRRWLGSIVMEVMRMDLPLG